MAADLVTLNAAIEAELPFLRAEAEARMTSRCTVRRKTGATTVVGGMKVPVWETVHTDLPLRRTDPGTRGVEIAGVRYPDATGRDDFPHDTDLEDGDHIEVTSGEWAGTVERVIKATKADQATARRVPVVEVPRPSEWA
jgi:transcription antitermination factor NusG